MKPSPFAVSVEFDAATNEVILWTPGRQLAGGWGLSTDECCEMEPEELERQLGACVLVLLSKMAGKSVGNRDYLAEHQRRLKAMVERHKQELADGEERAIIDIAHLLLSMAVAYGNHSAIDEAEAELRAAAAKGNSVAAAYLVDEWPQEKEAVLAVLRRGRP